MSKPVVGLIWLDLETTGLEVDEAGVPTAGVLEIAAVGTDMLLRQVGEPFHRVNALIDMPPVNRWHPAVIEMHGKNGLMVEAANVQQDRGLVRLSDEGIDKALVEWVHETFAAPVPEGVAGKPFFRKGDGLLMLAGAGVSHFDHAIVKMRWPKFAAFLHYATLDVSVLKRFQELVLGVTQPEREEPHRALPDVLAALDLAVHFAAQGLKEKSLNQAVRAEPRETVSPRLSAQ